MRGKENFKVKKVQHIRITPAYAGKRKLSVLGDQCCQDHPRLCGEKSPYVLREDLPDGITPAYAGKSFMDNMVNAVKRGSPPPMRGKDVPRIVHVSNQRITPAYAGKS